MRIFITGISGFVGAGLARGLLGDGAEVHGLVRPSSNLWRLADIRDRLHLHSGDLLDAESMRAALHAARPDALFHLGVYGAYPTQKDKNTIVRTSLLATMDLLDMAKEAGVGIIVNTGSSSEYGTKNHPMREDEIIEPNGYYAVGKAAQTLYCQQFAREEKIPVITLRLFSVFGPYEEPTRFIPTLISNALANKDIPLANASTARDFVYLDDCVEAYRLAARHPELSEHIFNVGSGVQHTIKEAFDEVVALSGSASRPLIGAYEGRDFDTSIWVADMDKTRSELGFSPRYTFPEGLRATMDWFKTHGDQTYTH